MILLLAGGRALIANIPANSSKLAYKQWDGCRLAFINVRVYVI